MSAKKGAKIKSSQDSGDKKEKTRLAQAPKEEKKITGGKNKLSQKDKTTINIQEAKVLKKEWVKRKVRAIDQKQGNGTSTKNSEIKSKNQSLEERKKIKKTGGRKTETPTKLVAEKEKKDKSKPKNTCEKKTSAKSFPAGKTKLEDKPNRKKAISKIKDTNGIKDTGRKVEKHGVQTRSMTPSLYQYYLTKVQPNADEKKILKEKAKNIVEKLITHIVDKQTTNNFNFAKKVLSCGSSSTKTDVKGLSDFDFNIPLIIQNAQTNTDDGISESCDENKSLGESAVIHRSTTKTMIPNGYAILYGRDGIVYPRKVRETLYQCLVKAVEALKLKDVSIDENVRGPAVGIIINTKKGDIDIDLSPSVEVTDIKLKGWPNGGSNVFDSDKGKQIKRDVQNAKIILVPKKDLFWRISYSNKIKTLINSMDRTGECRKRIHKILKYNFQMWKIEERCRFEGISTFIFSNHILWLNEENNTDHYWSQKNIDNCYKNMLVDLANRLEEGSLNHYFDSAENLLETVNKNVLRQLARTIRKKI